MEILIYVMHLGLKKEKFSQVSTLSLLVVWVTSGKLLVVLQLALPNLIKF